MVTVKSTINISSQTVPQIIPVVQSDTGRSIQFMFADFKIPTGSTARYYIQKPSGNAVYNNATIEDNNVVVNLTAQAIAETGDNYGQVRIEKDGEIVTSFDFILLVKAFRGIGAVESETEMNIFDQAVEQAEAAITEAKEEALAEIGEAGSGNIAVEFDAADSYLAGEYVIYNAKLYKFTSAHTGLWTGSDAEELTVGDALTDLGEETTSLKEDLAYEKDRIGDYLFDGLYVPSLELSRGTINTSTGLDQVNNYRVRTNKIYFGDSDIIYCSLKQGYSLYWYIYDSNDNLIGKNGWNNYSSAGDKTISRTQYTGAYYIRIVYQIQDASTTILPIATAYQFKVYRYINPVSPYCYISPTGNDANKGTKENPFATIQGAVNKGYKNICIVAGEYHQSLAVSNIDGLNIYADNTDDYANYTKKPKPVFTNGTFFDTFSTDVNGYKYFALSSDDAPSTYKAVFINHTQQPIITGDYPSYRASLWANHTNKYDDFRVKPVLTYEELSENNTFYYDGTNVYFHIEDAVTGVTMGGATSYVFNFANCNDLTVNGIDFMYADSMNFQVLKSNNVKVSNCNFGYTMRSNCVTASYSNVVFENCEAFKATIDGFNSHYYGLSVFNNCRGVYNYDDGESSHEYCEIIVHGGEYAYNGKGGHAPVNGCKFKCDSTYTHHNKYGFYMVGNSNFDTADILISNSVAKNNVTYDLQNTIYNTKIWNNIIGTQHISSGTVTDLSA